MFFITLFSKNHEKKVIRLQKIVRFSDSIDRFLPDLGSKRAILPEIGQKSPSLEPKIGQKMVGIGQNRAIFALPDRQNVLQSS